MNISKSSNASQNYPFALLTDITTQDYGNETLIYNLKTNKMFHLNETSSLIWQACDGQSSIAQIARKVGQKLAVYTSEELVWLALQQLQNNGLLAEDTNLAVSFNRLSRREIIKKAGVASMVAFPLITSVIAPSAIQAASSTANAGCTSDCGDATTTDCGCAGASCADGSLIDINVGAGICVSAAVALDTYGISVAAGAEGNVCVGANVCI